MNGTAPKIEIIKPFEQAFEVMKRMLFKPFDFNKWLVVGFAAFLSGYFGGGGFSFPYNPGQQHRRSDEAFPGVSQFFQDHTALVIALCVAAFFLVLALVLVFTWLRSRGTFIFTDCIVHNRGAIKQPWREYRREGNSLFFFVLAILGLIFLVVGIIVALCLVIVGAMHSAHAGTGTGIAMALVAVVALFAWIAFCVFFALLHFFMPMVMYRQRCRAWDAFRILTALIFDHLGSFVLFLLFGIAIFIGFAIASGIATCATCCMAALPYVGAVVMLPALVWLRAYGLLFLRQFGPDYDVWAGQDPLPPGIPPAPPPLVTA
jgi:MFS family permease